MLVILVNFYNSYSFTKNKVIDLLRINLFIYVYNAFNKRYVAVFIKFTYLYHIFI